jgi:CRISPR/Cas system endoribonuclease Cas6 (RAMP superfamily)
MQQASFNGLLKSILYIFAFYYIIKFLARLFLPHIVKKVVKKAEEQFNEQNKKYQNQSTSNTTNQKPNSDIPKATKKVGDYIDYEEVD